MPEQSPQPVDSATSVEDRLSAYLSTPPEGQADEAQPDEVDATSDQPEVDAETEATPDVVEVEADDGTKYQIPSKLKDQMIRWKDYTQKTQAAATLAERAQDALQFAEANQQVLASVASDIGEYRAVQAEFAKFQNADWSAIYAADPGQALKLRDQRDQLAQRLQGLSQQLQIKANHVKTMAEQHAANQWNLAEKGVMDAVGNISAADNVAMAHAAKALGFTDRELKGKFADARVLHAIYKAAKWDQLQAGKSGVLNSVQKAPPVVKPGVSKGPGAAATAKYQDQRAQLKKTGSVDDAARLLARFK